jgi:TRAP-type C4-dicarboxylate transport system permease small subunit
MSGEQVLSSVITEIYEPIYQAVVGVSIIYFIYGAAKYVLDLNNPEKQTFGKSHLLYGMIGMFIILSVGGILDFLSGIFNGLFQ